MNACVSLLLVTFLAAAAAGAARLSVTVVDQRTSKPLTDLKAESFIITDDGAQRRVESAEYTTGPVDVMLLLDTSVIGGTVQPAAAEFVKQLGDKDQMAVVSFHSSADLIQDFTSSQELLMRAIGNVRYGNSPHLLDALYASIDGGFSNAAYRRVLLLLTAGVDGPSRVTEREVLSLAKQNGVSIYPVYVMGYGRSLFETLARQTGGASFNLRDLSRSREPIGPRVFEVLRGHYAVTTAGNSEFGEKLKVELKDAPKKVAVSVLPVE